MDANNELRLRLRFYKDVNINTTALCHKFVIYANSNPAEYSVKTRGTHIWINIKGTKKYYYSPHLHLELESKSESETHIRGLFGPDPTLWTLFMFLHFVIAGIFLIFSGIAYSNSVLNKSYTFDIVVLVLMVISWVLLYFMAKQIRSNGNNQTHELEKVFLEIIES